MTLPRRPIGSVAEHRAVPITVAVAVAVRTVVPLLSLAPERFPKLATALVAATGRTNIAIDAV